MVLENILGIDDPAALAVKDEYLSKLMAIKLFGKNIYICSGLAIKLLPIK